jgi:hypothetical protein
MLLNRTHRSIHSQNQMMGKVRSLQVKVNLIGECQCKNLKVKNPRKSLYLMCGFLTLFLENGIS